jgi:RNA-splicing ligase RtcB
MITGNDLIAWGYEPGPWFKAAIAHANVMKLNGNDEGAIREELTSFAPPPVEYISRRPHGEHLPYHLNIEAENEGEVENIAAVRAHMDELMRVPTIKAGAVMPDACPAGSAKGTIPVGGVVACENAIHPGYHSADICCSMAITVLGKVDPKLVLDAGHRLTHFGPGGRDHCADLRRLSELALEVGSNPFLNTEQMGSAMHHHLGTQGDGNHFFYVGTMKSTGETAIVTHHGSRKPGALLYKAGMRVAEASTKKIAPSVPKHQSWIVADSQEGQDYWRALQTLRKWTKMNHFLLHDWVGAVLGFGPKDRFWNEHNFVFQRTDGLFYHAKGATPAYPNFSGDTNGLTLIPMNMGEPILIASGLNAPHGLGFAPHGAGRNYSRTAHKAQVDAKIAAGATYREATGLTPDIDVRWFSGTPDVSEMPHGYKSASSVRRQIATYKLTRIVDEVLPYGCIMAGEFDWREAGKRLGEMA